MKLRTIYEIAGENFFLFFYFIQGWSLRIHICLTITEYQTILDDIKMVLPDQFWCGLLFAWQDTNWK